MKKKLVCLSSGSETQYRLDNLRVMALPEGADIQFRYDADLIEPSVLASLEGDKLHKSSALLGYLDLTKPVASPGTREALPCRHAELIDCQRFGRFLVLRFRLGAFVECGDLSAFRTGIQSKSPRAKEDKYEGFWVFEHDYTKAVAKSDDMTAWQTTIKRLAGSPDYASEDFFFRVMGLFRSRERNALSPLKGEYHLKSSTEYEWRILHFHPDSDAHKRAQVTTIVEVSSASEDIKAVTSPILAIDSSYDLKSFHFRTSAVTTNAYGAFTFKFTATPEGSSPADAAHPGQPELFLPLRIAPSWFRALFSVAVLTGLLFWQQYISATSKGGIPRHTSVGLLLLALGTATLAVFGLKKPL